MLPEIKKYKAVFLTFIGVFTLLTVAISLVSFFNPDLILLHGETGYEAMGRFSLMRDLDINKDFQILRTQDQGITLWSSQINQDEPSGKLISSPFNAPHLLSLIVSGYPNTPGNELFVERVDSHEQRKLKLKDPGKHWSKNRWLLPVDWHHHLIRIVAIDNAKIASGWIGVSSPLESNLFNLLRSQIPLLIILPIYLIHFLLFFSPGLFLADWLIQKQELSRVYTVILSVLISTLIGYFYFWIYLLNNYLGIVFSILMLLVSIYCLTSPVPQRSLKSRLAADVIFPLLIIFFVGLFYLLILCVFEPYDSSLESLVRNLFFNHFPNDNSLPRIFAEKLYAGRDPRDLGAGWLSSDRPPLQTGLTLVQRPIMVLGANYLHYQVLATIAQCSWIASVWALCRTIKLSGDRIALVLSFSIFSGFFLFNSIYVWPKLLAAAFAVFAFSLLLKSVWESRPLSYVDLSLAAVATAMALLSHGGIIFTLPAFALLLVNPQTFPGVRSILIGCAVFGLLTAPWSAYQKFYNPPGNRLVKWHIAGVPEIDSRSSFQAIFDSYRSLSAEEIASNKWKNLRVLFESLNSEQSFIDKPRETEFFYTFKGLGILNMGWLVLLLAPLTRRFHRLSYLFNFSLSEFKAVSIILGASLVSLLFWVLLMFGPATTIIHQGSYATMTLLFTGLAILISGLTRFLTYFLLSLQVVGFAVIWIFTIPSIAPKTLVPVPNIWMIVLAIAALIRIIELLNQLAQQKLTHFDP